MGYSIVFARRALRDLKSLSAVDQTRVAKRIDALAQNPRPHGSKKLQASEDLYRIRSGDFRVIYSITDRELLVLVIRIGNRRDIYG